MKKIIIPVMVLYVLIVILAGCGGEKAPDDNNVIIKVTDQLDREVLISEVPQRIISLSPSNTEIAFALGLGERMVGVTDYCNYPPETEDKPKVGGFANPNVEEIMALEPDLILAGNLHQEELSKLEQFGIPVLVLAPQSLVEIYDSLELVAAATGMLGEAEEILTEMRGRIVKIQEKLTSLSEKKRLRVFYELYGDPLMSVGATSVINEIITLAGGLNIFADIQNDYPKVSAEVVAQRDPQVIIFPKAHGTEEFTVETFKERPGWGAITAVKEDRVYGVEADMFSRPGPRVVDAVEEAARLFYPELFK